MNNMQEYLANTCDPGSPNNAQDMFPLTQASGVAEKRPNDKMDRLESFKLNLP